MGRPYAVGPVAARRVAPEQAGVAAGCGRVKSVGISVLFCLMVSLASYV